MPRLEDLEKLSHPALNIFFVLDASGEMTGFGRAVLNHAMEETVKVIKGLAGNCMDARIMASFLTHGSGCR